VVGPYVSDQPSGCGHLAIALKVDTMAGDDAFAARVDDLIDATKSVAPAEGFSEVFYPGELEQRSEEAAGEQGVALAAKTVSELHELAATCDVDVDLTPRSGS
jgi:LDH2 family malate/lactate/ureidoglycolate dehydrogenase